MKPNPLFSTDSDLVHSLTNYISLVTIQYCDSDLVHSLTNYISLVTIQYCDSDLVHSLTIQYCHSNLVCSSLPISSGPVTHSLLCWDLELRGVKGQGRGGGRQPVPPVMPFQKQLLYSRERGGGGIMPLLLGGEDPVRGGMGKAH